MVCVAAFIILCILSVFVALLSIFRRDIGKKYWKTFKKAWGCVWKKVRLQKCETRFKEEVKNSILSHVIIKKPKLTKPISIAIEVISVAIVLLTIWSLAVVIKGGLSLIVFGNCDVRNPENCFTGSQVCSEVQPGPSNPIVAVGLWFADFGIIGEGLWSKFKNWDAADYIPQIISDNDQYYNPYDPDKPTALSIFDPGCSNCLQSYLNEKSSGFFDSHNVAIMPYVLGNGEGGEKFNNSSLISSFIVATYYYPLQSTTSRPAAWLLIDRLFTDFDKNNENYQSVFSNPDASPESVETTLKSWLGRLGYSPSELAYLSALAHSDRVKNAIEDFRDIAIHKIHIDIPVVGVPTTIFDGNRKSGIF